MHYKNGREAKEMDPVIVKTYDRVMAGVLHSIRPSQTSCNGQVAYPVPGATYNLCETIGNMYHAEDAWAAIEAAQPKVVEPPPQVAEPAKN